MKKLIEIHKNIISMYNKVNDVLNEGNKPSGSTLVYHYTDAFALKSILENGTLWFSNSNFMNDSTETIYSLELINKLSQEVIVKRREKGFDAVKKHNYFRGKVNLLIEKIHRKLKGVFILSTSKNPDSLALWSNYSSCNGYNIGMVKSELNSLLQNMRIKKIGNIYTIHSDDFRFAANTGECIDSRYKFSIMCNSVIYNPEKQKDILSKYVNILYDEICDHYYKASDSEEINCYINDQIIESLAAHLSIYSIFIKNPGFSQEEEYRIAFTVLLDKDINNIVKFRICNGIFIPYLEVKFDFENNYSRSLPLKSITIGPKNNIDIAVEGLKNMLNILEYETEKIVINKSIIPLRY